MSSPTDPTEQITHHHGSSLSRRRVDPAWLKLNAEIGEVVNEWSLRRDLVAYVAKDGGRGLAAALYDPDKAEIEVNTAEAFGEHIDPEHVGDFTNRKTQFDWAKAAGLVMHEAAHARWSTVHLSRVYEDVEENKQVLNTYQLLDESRIEYQAVEARPKDRAFVRASALSLVMLDEETRDKMLAMNPTELAIRLSLLGHARVDGGVLERSDLVEVRKITDTIIPAKTFKKMRKLWMEFQSKDDRYEKDYERMIEIAKEMVELINETHDQNGTKASDKPREKGEEGEAGEGGEGGEGGGEELTDAQKELIGKIMDALEKSQRESQGKAEDEAHDQKKVEEYEERSSKAREDQKQKEENQKTARDTFNLSQGPFSTRSRSRVTQKREPSTEERVTANRVGQAMDKAKYRDRVKTESRSVTPPGRLRVSQAMQGSASKQNGGSGEVDAWSLTRRRHTDETPLTLGLMCDISGSMGASMEPMAVAAWVMSEAVRRIQGRAAAVYYGEAVFPVLKPGEHLPEVTVYSASDGTEAFNDAFKSLDGALNLLQGEGARILVICSDGQYKGSEQQHCIKWLNKCRLNGVAVVWLGFKDSYGNLAQKMCKDAGAEYVEVGKDVVSATKIIGDACTKALTQAGSSRAV